MRLRALISRFALTTAAAGLAVTGLAMPAQADPQLDYAYIGILAPETVTVINGQTKTVKVDLYNFSATAVKNVVLNFGSATKPVGADLGFTAPAGCEENVCELGDFKPGQKRSFKFTVKPAAAGTTSPAQSISVSTSIAGKTSDEVAIGVVRTEKGGVDLEMGDIADLKLSPGKSANVPVVVRNSGNKDVKALGLVVMTTYLTPALDYSNCEKVDEEGLFAIICVFNDTLTAGGTFTLPEKSPLRIKVPTSAAGPFDYPAYVGAVGLSDKWVLDFTKRTAGAAGKELKLEALTSVAAEEPEAVEDLNEDDNFADFSVSVPKTSADVAAVGGAFTGAIGDDDTVEVGLRNLGPSTTLPMSMTWIQYAHVELPTGVELTRVDERCLPGTSLEDIDDSVRDIADITDLVCMVFEPVPVRERYLFSLTAEILDTAEHKAGSVTADGGVQDSKNGNNKAALTVKLTAGGSGGGLPITGAPTGLIAAAGAVLLAAGALTYRTTRRRRIITVVE